MHSKTGKTCGPKIGGWDDWIDLEFYISTDWGLSEWISPFHSNKKKGCILQLLKLVGRVQIGE